MLQDRYKKVNIVNDQISGWAKRCHAKFSALVDTEDFKYNPDNMVKIFEVMEGVTCKEL